MRYTKEVKISILVAALITGIGSAILTLNAVNMADYVWIFFVGFTISTATVKGIKNIGNVVCSHLAGWIWAMVMFYICLFVVGKTGSLPLGFFVCIFLGSCIMLAFHLGFTMKTPFNNISIMYATIFCWFSSKDYSKIPYIIAAFLLGAILSMISDEIQGALLKK